MDWLIWIGAAVSLGGIAGLLRCIQLALRIQCFLDFIQQKLAIYAC